LLDGSTSLGTSALANGAATFTIASLAAGTHSITASYDGDTADGASTSSAVSVQVNAAPLQATAVTLTASPTTAVSGQTITLTAKVAETSGSYAPTGMVTFQDSGSAVGSSPLAAGTGTLAVGTLSVGTHSLSAVYSGDTANSPSTSTAVSVTITAASAPPPTPAADYGLTLSSGTLTVAQGTPGSLMVSIAPENGFSASLSFACSGVPSGWGCTFAPSTLSGSAPQSTKMTISASNTSELMAPPSGLLLALVLPIPLFLLDFSGGRSRRALWMALIACVIALTGCGTSFRSSPQGQSSTYNVTITASGASAPTHTQTLVLTMTSAQ